MVRSFRAELFFHSGIQCHGKALRIAKAVHGVVQEDALLLGHMGECWNATRFQIPFRDVVRLRGGNLIHRVGGHRADTESRSYYEEGARCEELDAT